MTHLRIEQNNILENVSSAVIAKLYELATSGDLDLSSNLAGNLYTTATYLEYIDVLHTAYPDLTISATNTYIMFEDPEVEAKLKGYVGDGVGVTTAGFLGLTTLNGSYSKQINGLWTTIDLFNSNTNLIKFNELALATNCTTLGNNAFLYCTNLEEINISNITSLGYYAFAGDRKCTFTGSGLSNILHMNSSGYLFLNCSKITGTLDLSNYLDTLIPTHAFDLCTGITEIIIPSTVTSIGTYCFYGCSSLTSVTLSSTCTTLGRLAFAGCSSLTTINTGNVTTLGGNQGGWVFQDCSSLTSLDLSSVTTASSYIFQGTNISNVVMPSIVSLGQTFTNASSVRTIDLGENLTNIESMCFWASGVTTIIFRGNTPPSFSDPQRGDKFLYDLSNLTIYVPDAKISDYQTALPGVASCITGISNLPQS